MVVAEELEVGENKVEYKKRVESERKERPGEKRLHGKFLKDVDKVADNRS